MEIAKAATDRAETVFDALGLGSGPLAPVARAGFGFALGTAGWYFLDSKLFNISYMPDGSTRPWALTGGEGSHPTLFPWWAPGAISGLLFGGFV